LNLPSSFKILEILISLLLVSAIAYADVCVWRDPERTMQKIFPQASDYKTITVKITPEHIKLIEKAIDTNLDESEKGEFNFYDIMGIVNDKTEKIGTIIALAGKGEYGVIEVVIGIDNKNKIVGAYIQRSRERVTKELQSSEFLSQFKNKTKDDSFELGKDIKLASSDAEAASRVVSFVIKKMLIFYNELRQNRE
jgi:hypothetical protein